MCPAREQWSQIWADQGLECHQSPETDSLSCNLSECYTLVVQYMLLFVCFGLFWERV